MKLLPEFIRSQLRCIHRSLQCHLCRRASRLDRAVPLDGSVHEVVPTEHPAPDLVSPDGQIVLSVALGAGVRVHGGIV